MTHYKLSSDSQAEANRDRSRFSWHGATIGAAVIAGLENVRGGMKITDYTEYFPGHAETDRAFDLGSRWAGDKK